MQNEEILSMLKLDLQISSSAYDEYLMSLISAAKKAIETEGIHLTDDNDDMMLVEMYAAFMYRQRRNENMQMPRMLRWQLNNRLFSEKAKVE